MASWQNINNSKEYAPLFIFFLDCVSQLIKMNTHQFEFTSHYLAHFGFNSFTNKYYELTSPIVKFDTTNPKQRLPTDEVKLLSLFQDSDHQNSLFHNQLFVNRVTGATGKIRNPMELDPTKITIWIEYFCRYDEGKKEYMTNQVQLAEENFKRAVGIEDSQKKVDNEVQNLLEKIRNN